MLAVFASFNHNRSDAEALARRDAKQCERSNAVRKTLAVLVESQLADIRAAAELAVNPGLHAQYAALVFKTEQIVNDPIVQEQLQIVDCSKI